MAVPRPRKTHGGAGGTRTAVWDKIDFQFDLMVQDPTIELKNFIQAGATQVILHSRSQNVEAALQTVVDMRTDEIGHYSVRAGIALGPQEQPEIVEQFEAQFDFVQVMGIDRGGRQENRLIKKPFICLSSCARYPHLPLQVDGRVSGERAHFVAAGQTAWS